MAALHVGTQAALSASQVPTLEMRVIALETKLRHHKPEHPCDCKYELSLLEEKLGGLDEHPWELRISEVERKQRRDAKDVSRLWKELRECQDRMETVMAEHRWASKQKEGTNRVVKSSNALYLVEQAVGRLREFERFQEELAACLVVLKKRCDEMEGDIRRVQPWMISEMVEKQEDVADKIVRLDGNAKTLQSRVGELMTLKGIVSKISDTIPDGVSSEVNEGKNTSPNSEPTKDDFLLETKPETQASRPLETKEKPEATDGEVVGISLAEALQEDSPGDLDILKRKRRRRRKRSTSASPVFAVMNEKSQPEIKIEGEQPDEKINIGHETTAAREYLHAMDSYQSTASAPPTMNCGYAIEDTDPETRVPTLFKKQFSARKTRPPLRKSKPRNIVRGRDKLKHIPMSELFKQGKGLNNGRSISKTVLDSGTISGIEAIMLR
ncbi:hypothetical protein TWF191_001294 [Orbilia oligospora]|uniref:Uncharacterized protein n=1 Tax=Orbilia oligospora TaxID=2813651 RepID=A0A7C8VC24_ORBOL|nr:hypothetical protein TWF191_001294 [Orbilia oligospora]